MGVSMSTLVGWGIIIGLVAVYSKLGIKKDKSGNNVRPAAPRQRLEEKQPKKESREKAKRQRVETHKDTERAPKTAGSNKPGKTPVVYTTQDSSDDGIDNREFARQLASIKKGTDLNTPKKSDEKRQKSVKQSRAQIIDDAPKETKPSEPAPVSAPSSTAGVDADDDESPNASPELKATNAGEVSDMLEPKAPGPSVLRLTDTDKFKPKKEKKAKEPEKTETKKQRQNRKKKEQEQEQRREDEQRRKAAEEAQRRTARVAEGRAAKDGSAFMAAQAQKPSVWTGNGTNGGDNDAVTNGDHSPAVLLDTLDEPYVKVDHPEAKPAQDEKKKAVTKPANWMAALPSEEAQMEMLRDEEDAWNTVTTKKSKRKTANAAAESANESDPSPAPVKAAPKAQPTNGPTVSAKPGKLYAQQSSFAALTTNDEPEVEENEWDV
ncbi:hypothetical protein QBC38DRAFT_104499 [Podospora fimiseda]|uniref:Uncharacterized protein n=1 Tax=Podospora fimiseda TaxID=252190 RepID=A0AAN7BTY6_9PEZI|nr:hypothetical protein QBC38DRAFT_104499 [Podospora fimiseda]